jgi:hypothetical protein
MILPARFVTDVLLQLSELLIYACIFKSNRVFVRFFYDSD